MPAFIHTGTAVRAQSATVSGSSQRTVTGTGAAVAQAAQVVGEGKPKQLGTGVLVAQAATVVGDGGRAPVWISTPNPLFSEGVSGQYDLKDDIDDDYPAGLTFSLSNLGALGAGIGWDPLNGIIAYSGVGAPSLSNHTATAIDAVGSAVSGPFNITIAEAGSGLWASRSTGTNVVWAHDFAAENELRYFTRNGSGDSNPDATALQLPLDWVDTSLGTKGYRQTILGAELKTGEASAAVDESQTWEMVNVAGWPDPALVGTYECRVGNGTNAIEAVLVTAIDYDTNIITLNRNIENSGSGGGACSAGYSLGRMAMGEWVRPFAAFPAGQNGRASADIGIANLKVTKARTWTTTQSSTAHADFKEGYVGHADYWLTGAKTYADWLTGTDSWDGEEIYLQFRVKVPAERFNQEPGKMLFVQNSGVVGNGQFFMTLGGQRWDEVPPSPDGATTYGRYLNGITCYGDSTAPAGGILAADGNEPDSDTGSVSNQLTANFPTCAFDYRVSGSIGGGMECWCFPADTWITIQLHFKYGKDNTVTPGVKATAPFLGDTGQPNAADYQTQVEVLVAVEGETAYTTVISFAEYLWFFGDVKGNYGQYTSNPPGINAFWCTQNTNDYVGGNPPPLKNYNVEYTQVIASRASIPVPVDSTTALEDAVNALSVGEWSIFKGPGTWPNDKPSGDDVLWTPAQEGYFWFPSNYSGSGYPGTKKTVAGWSFTGHYDPVRKKVVSLGSEYGPTGCVVYDELANDWTMWCIDQDITHTWAEVGYDPNSGTVYWGRLGTVSFKLDIDNPGGWSTAPSVGASSDTNGLAYWPSKDSLYTFRRGDNAIYKRRTDAASWTLVGDTGVDTGVHPFAVHNPIRDVMIVGGGQNNPTAFFEVDINDNITALSNNSGNPGVDAMRDKVFCSALNGDIIVTKGIAGTVHKYEYGTGWSVMPAPFTFPQLIKDAQGFGVATYIPKAGKEVIMYCMSPSQGGDQTPDDYCYLYRYS